MKKTSRVLMPTLRAPAAACAIVWLSATGAHLGAAEILPGDVGYDADVPTVGEVLGQEIGRWHLRHDQLVRYFERLAEASPRLELVEQGRTHEGRPQLLLIATSEANHARLDEIVAARRALVDPDGQAPAGSELDALPSVAYLGYSIHGNEASGSNAAPLVAYYLAAARDPRVEEWLSSVVVLIDPSLNPDGMGRFAQWANMHRGARAVADPEHREHNEGWPSGRTNHYWFDLNRDWLLLQHPESRARVRSFHHWKPNLLGDYHEMGSNSTYFFQPGVPERENPLKPERNIELTRVLAELHARNLDADDQLYYSEETFDDFYPGKGSTYPDLNGAVGVLFEQASARGHAQETDNGELTFERAIRNHFLTSLSMIEGAASYRRELLEYQSDFYRGASRLAAADPVGAFVFGCPRDPARCARLLEVVRGHQVEVHRLGRGLEVGDEVFDPAWSWIVPLDQPQYRLVRALFQRQTEFRDSTFYDISTWTLPLAFGALSTTIERTALSSDHLGDRVDEVRFPGGSFTPDEEAYAYLFEWDAYFAPRALNRLHEAGFAARVATGTFQAEVPDGRRDFGRGTVVVPVAEPSRRRELEDLLRHAADRDGVDVWSTRSGLTPLGLDLGSPEIRPLAPVKPVLVAGSGTSAYEVGEAWHLLDLRFGIEVSLVEIERLAEVDLGSYTHVLMVDGDYDDLDPGLVDELRRWIEAGGILVATKSAAVWAGEKVLAEPMESADAAAPSGASAQTAPPTLPEPSTGEPPSVERRPYGDFDRDRAAQLVSGAIFEVELDRTHPMAFGYPSDRLPVFRNSTLQLDDTDNPYERVAVYGAEPLLSGYVSDERLAEIPGRPAMLVTKLGEGTVISLIDNPNFRAFWYGTSKLYLNGLFFGSIVEPTSPPGDW